MAQLQGKPGTIIGHFFCSHQEPVSDTASNNNNDTAKEEKVSKIPSRCQLNCEEGSLSVYELSDSMKTPFLVLPKIRKVSRQKHDKEFFCLEYGTETNRFNIFLTIEDKSDAEKWEIELCKLTGQTPPRPRAQTGVLRRPNTNRTINPLSSPSAPEGFSLTTPRDGQQFPEESHLKEVVGSPNVSLTPSPENSPNNGPIDEDPNEAHANSVLDETNLARKLEEHQQQEQQQQRQEEVGKEQHATSDEILSEILPLKSEIPRSSDHQLPSGLALSRAGELSSTEPVYQCTHIEIECSQEKSSLTINKKDFLSTGEINDMFVFYRGSVYLKSCPASFQSQLFIGTRILQVNNQEPVDARRAIDYITTSAGQTVNLLVQSFPLGVRLRLCVPSVAALGITRHGNEIMSMHGGGVMSRIADGLRCVCPALSTTDMPSPSAVEHRSITAIGDSHVPFDATAEEVEYMLDSAIKIGNGHLVLQLQPTEFCQAIAPNALQRRIVEEDNALLNLRPVRRSSRPSLSLPKILKSNPPS